MNRMRPTALALAASLLAIAPGALAQAPSPSPASALPGYVDGSMFRALIDEDQEIIEVNLDGAILQALAKSKSDDPTTDDSSDLFTKLKSIHAVIGTVKGPASAGASAVQKTDQALLGKGWQRIARIKDDTSTVSVLTHTSNDRVDGLVVLTFDTEDKELVFANLAGEIDVTRLGEIGDRLNFPGLGDVPGVR